MLLPGIAIGVLKSALNESEDKVTKARLQTVLKTKNYKTLYIISPFTVALTDEGTKHNRIALFISATARLMLVWR